MPDLAQLNRRYYSVAPHAYLRQRLHALVSAAAALPRWGERLRDGLELGPLTIQSEPPADPDFDGLEHFVVVESVALQYLAAETLMRLYLAHADKPEAPWLALSDPRMPVPKVLGEVRRRFLDTDDEGPLRQEVCDIVLDRSHLALDGVSPEFVEGGVDDLMAMMYYFAGQLNEWRTMYNATKHGLALVSGSAALRFFSADGESLLSAGKDPSITYLERAKADDGSHTWYEVIRWIHPVETWAFSYTAVSLTELIWMVGRRRHGIRQDGDSVTFPPTLNPGEVMRHAGGDEVRSMRQRLPPIPGWDD